MSETSTSNFLQIDKSGRLPKKMSIRLSPLMQISANWQLCMDILQKIIWLRFGNTTTQNMADKLAAKADIILEFSNNNQYSDVAVVEIDD